MVLNQQNIQIQMQQNILRKEITLIEQEINTEMQRIASLLQLIASLQKQPCLTKQQQQCNGELNETYNQTDYDTTATDLYYNFKPIQHSLDQQILLDGYENSQCLRQICIDNPKQIGVIPTSSWIDCFLDWDDAKVMFEHHHEIVQLLSISNKYFNCLNSQHHMFPVESSQVYKAQDLIVEFPKHTKGWQLNLNVESQNMLYQITIEQKIRLLFQCPNSNSELIRFLLIKEQEDDNYEITWGSYSQQPILQSLILQPGTYIILPLSQYAQTCNIYYQQTASVFINKTQERPFKTFNLLKKLFEECKQSLGLKRSYSLVDTQGTQKQFVRSCYMNYGIIVQIYYNIFEEECSFIDQCGEREDKQLLFPDLYSASQIKNIVAPGEQLFKFYMINKKPANLFVPHKKVFVGNHAMQNLTFHHVFK